MLRHHDPLCAAVLMLDLLSHLKAWWCVMLQYIDLCTVYLHLAGMVMKKKYCNGDVPA